MEVCHEGVQDEEHFDGRVLLTPLRTGGNISAAMDILFAIEGYIPGSSRIFTV